METCNHIYKVTSTSRFKKCIQCGYVTKENGIIEPTIDKRPETKQWAKLTFPGDPYLQRLVQLGLL